MLHRVFSFIFMLGVTLSAIFTIVEVRLDFRWRSCRSLTFQPCVASFPIALVRIIPRSEKILSAVPVAMAIAFSVILGRKDRSGLDVGGEFSINITYPLTDIIMAPHSSYSRMGHWIRVQPLSPYLLV